MNSGAKLYLGKCAALLGAVAILGVLQATFLEDPIEFLIPSVLLAGGLYLGFFEKTPVVLGRVTFAKPVLGVLLILLSLWTARPPDAEAVLPWKPYSQNALDEALRLKKPVMIDFFATWCGPCLELDRKVFSRKATVEEARRFVCLRADLSDRQSSLNADISSKFAIEGIPTVVFFGSDGKEMAGLRLLGVESASAFRRRMAQCQ